MSSLVTGPLVWIIT